MSIISKKEVSSWPLHDNEEKMALIKVLDEGRWGSCGDETERFATNFCNFLGMPYGICTTNGTSSLQMALRALDIGYGDQVIVPAYTYFATFGAVSYMGAEPVIADVDENTMNISANEIEKLITDKTRAIIIVHFGGKPCDMDAILRICDKRGIYLIEDSAQAHGSEWRGQKVGSFGIISCFSFQRSKVLTCGEGGFVATKSKIIYEKLWSLHDNGRRKDDYHHYSIGTNMTMTEFQAAILNCQLKKLPSQNEIRAKNAKRLSDIVSKFHCFTLLETNENITSENYYAFIIKYSGTNKDRNRLIDYLKQNNIPAIPGYVPVNKQPAIGQNPYDCPIAVKLAETIIWIKHNFLLSNQETIEKVEDVMKQFCEA